IGARVMTDRKSGATFPTDHPLHGGATELIVNCDVILSLDWVDLAGTLHSAHGGKPVTAKIIQVSVDQYVHNGWCMDYQGLPPTACLSARRADAHLAPVARRGQTIAAGRPPVTGPPPYPPPTSGGENGGGTAASFGPRR